MWAIQPGMAAIRRAVAGALIYLLRDLFGTIEAAPIASPRTAAPGPGTLTTVDTGSKVSITASGLRYASSTVNQTDPVVQDSLARARVAGRTFGVTTTLARARVGWAQSGSSNADVIGMGTSGGSIYVLEALSTRGPLFALADGTQYTIECVLRDQGGMVFVTGGAWATRTLVWVTSGMDVTDETTTPLRATLGFGNGSGVTLTSTDWQEIDYGGAWGARFGLATAYQLYTSTPATILSTADGVFEVVWVVGATEILEVRFRRTDDDNCWLVRADANTNTFKLYTRIAGVETEFDPGKTPSFAATRRRITIRCEGTRIITAVGGIMQHNITTGGYNSSVGGMNASGAALLSSIASWPLTGFVEPTQANPPKNILPHGDSKTAGSGDTTPPPLGYGGYPALITEQLYAATGSGWYERPYRIATGGATVATLKSTIDASLASAIGTPDYILVNMGINDTNPIVVVQATWQSNYGYILDAFRAKWPNARILVAYVWGIGRDSDCNTLAGWIDGVLATRPWASVGLDERVVLKGADNGASEMFDTVHPNHLGYTLVAAAWKTSMGY